MANIINKGIRSRVTAKGDIFADGREYTCTLYYSAKAQDGRATVKATATTIDGVVVCPFVFEPADTAKLKTGSVIMEIYDAESLEQMSYVENFATVRSNSIVA